MSETGRLLLSENSIKAQGRDSCYERSLNMQKKLKGNEVTPYNHEMHTCFPGKCSDCAECPCTEAGTEPKLLPSWFT